MRWKSARVRRSYLMQEQRILAVWCSNPLGMVISTDWVFPAEEFTRIRLILIRVTRQHQSASASWGLTQADW